MLWNPGPIKLVWPWTNWCHGIHNPVISMRFNFGVVKIYLLPGTMPWQNRLTGSSLTTIKIPSILKKPCTNMAGHNSSKTTTVMPSTVMFSCWILISDRINWIKLNFLKTWQGLKKNFWMMCYVLSACLFPIRQPNSP